MTGKTGMERLRIPVPEAARGTDFDRVQVRQGGLEESLDGVWALGHLRPVR